ncbi:hypothetical protein P22_1815 [Propionispora sp. 2/2-37]|uniref:hypothetical protein n=1 Tax=Propionispora sp. 2/2-37 TaxID=1677858 RepID=UPI0006BB8F44|nr:hypothetical protein [Propionispora sp. 2/2-37]CUH95735.1 hypothetical protein P22_1815 [Propionispora sp. 2/2-37]
MAIWRIELESRDYDYYRKWLHNRGFVAAGYFSSNGFDVKKMRKLAEAGKVDAMRCVFGKSVRWYYSEAQAELARLRGELG